MVERNFKKPHQFFVCFIFLGQERWRSSGKIPSRFINKEEFAYLHATNHCYAGDSYRCWQSRGFSEKDLTVDIQRTWTEAATIACCGGLSYDCPSSIDAVWLCCDTPLGSISSYPKSLRGSSLYFWGQLIAMGFRNKTKKTKHFFGDHVFVLASMSLMFDEVVHLWTTYTFFINCSKITANLKRPGNKTS